MEKALAAHGFGGLPAPPKSAELWEKFTTCPETETVRLEVSNLFFAGYDDGQLDWSRPVHGVLMDFKGDSMQTGMVLERLEQRGDQYVVIAGSCPSFNGGWHFTAVTDYEHPVEQSKMSWQTTRVWTRVNYICTASADGEPALTPRDSFDPGAKHTGAKLVSSDFKLSSIICTGGLMPHTLCATAIADNGPTAKVIEKHMQLGATLAAVGHGLDAFVACGSAERSLVAGLEAAAFPTQRQLLEANGMRSSSEQVCRDGQLITAGHWSASTKDEWFRLLGLDAGEGATSSLRVGRKTTEDIVHSLHVSKLPGMKEATYIAGEATQAGPLTAVFVDEVADPTEIFTIVAHLRKQEMGFMLVSRSADESSSQSRAVTTETVFGNPMYPLRDCRCVLPTTPADVALRSGAVFDSFFVAGGQCPYRLQHDAAVIAIMDAATVAAPVCHGAEAMHGSKWLAPDASLRFTAYSGCWVSFRHVLDRFQRMKPGETMRDGLLFSGNAPNSTAALVTQACDAISRLRAGESML